LGILFIFSAPKLGSAKALAIIWPWAFFPAVTGAFIIYYLNVSIYTKNENYQYKLRFKEALFQGAITAMVGIIVAIVSLDRSNEFGSLRALIAQRLHFIIFSVTVFGLVGAGIGYTFPQRYRNIVWRERRSHSRHVIPSHATIFAEGKPINCNLVDISLSGAAVDTDIPHGFGSHVEIELPDFGKLPGIIVRKEMNNTCLKLLLNTTLEDKVRVFVNQFLSQPQHSLAPGT
jgi:hypothetical protein